MKKLIHLPKGKRPGFLERRNVFESWGGVDPDVVDDLFDRIAYAARLTNNDDGNDVIVTVEPVGDTNKTTVSVPRSPSSHMEGRFNLSYTDDSTILPTESKYRAQWPLPNGGYVALTLVRADEGHASMTRDTGSACYTNDKNEFIFAHAMPTSIARAAQLVLAEALETGFIADRSQVPN